MASLKTTESTASTIKTRKRKLKGGELDQDNMTNIAKALTPGVTRPRNAEQKKQHARKEDAYSQLVANAPNQNPVLDSIVNIGLPALGAGAALLSGDRELITQGQAQAKDFRTEQEENRLRDDTRYLNQNKIAQQEISHLNQEEVGSRAIAQGLLGIEGLNLRAQGLEETAQFHKDSLALKRQAAFGKNKEKTAKQKKEEQTAVTEASNTEDQLTWFYNTQRDLTNDYGPAVTGPALSSGTRIWNIIGQGLGLPGEKFSRLRGQNWMFMKEQIKAVMEMAERAGVRSIDTQKEREAINKVAPSQEHDAYTNFQISFAGLSISGKQKAYRDAGGGKKGNAAVENYMLYVKANGELVNGTKLNPPQDAIPWYKWSDWARKNDVIRAGWADGGGDENKYQHPAQNNPSAASTDVESILTKDQAGDAVTDAEIDILIEKGY